MIEKKEAARFWNKNFNEKNLDALVLFVESESEESCPNSCWCNRGFCIENPLIIGRGSYGITYSANYIAKKLGQRPVIMKMIITNSKQDVDSAKQESNLQIEAWKKIPNDVAKIYNGKFCHPKCLLPFQGIYTIIMERLNVTFFEVMDSLVSSKNFGSLLVEMRNAAQAFSNLNSQGIWHGDAHMSNIMKPIDGHGYKIIDFGFAQKIDPSQIIHFRNIDAFFFIIRTLVYLRETFRVKIEEIPKLLNETAELVADFITTFIAKDAYNAWDDRITFFLSSFDLNYKSILNAKIVEILKKKRG